jgi:hypothetical protein
MPAKRSSAATRVSAAEAYAWGHLPGESLLWLAGQTLLASLTAPGLLPEPPAALAATQATVERAAEPADAAWRRLQDLGSQRGLLLAVRPALAERSTLAELVTAGKALPPRYRSWLQQVRGEARAITGRAQADVLSLGEAAADLQLALWLALVLLQLDDAAPLLPQLKPLARELDHARNNAAQRLILTLGSRHCPTALQAQAAQLDACLMTAPPGLSLPGRAHAEAYSQWLSAVLDLLQGLTTTAARTP